MSRITIITAAVLMTAKMAYAGQIAEGKGWGEFTVGRTVSELATAIGEQPNWVPLVRPAC
jgi:hypothetical protein